MIVQTPTLSIEYDGPTTITLDDYIVAAELARASETIDARTFSKPRRSQMGGGMDTLVIAFRWSVALYELMVDHEAEIGECSFTPVTGGKTFTFETRFRKAPLGQFQPGQTVEVDVPFAVLTDVDWSA